MLLLENRLVFGLPEEQQQEFSLFTLAFPDLLVSIQKNNNID